MDPPVLSQASKLQRGELLVPLHSLTISPSSNQFAVQVVELDLAGRIAMVAFSDAEKMQQHLPGFGHVVPQPSAWIDLITVGRDLVIDPGCSNTVTMSSWETLLPFSSQSKIALEKCLEHRLATVTDYPQIVQGIKEWAAATPGGTPYSVTLVDDRQPVGIVLSSVAVQGGQLSSFASDLSMAVNLPVLQLDFTTLSHEGLRSKAVQVRTLMA